MSQEEQQNESEQEIPKGQFYFDNLLWLFILSLVISFVIYNAWGLIEIMSTPVP